MIQTTAESMTTQILQGRFEIETQLSCTDFSTVYSGSDRKYVHRPQCLITAIPYHQREIRHRLEREAQILEQLGRHPQVPRLLTYFYKRDSKMAGTFYLVQDHIDGHTLSEELTVSCGLPKKLSEGYVTKLLQDVLVALTFVHEQGVVHQNVHPQNLIRQKQDGSIFLTGFGAISKIARSKVAGDGALSSSIPASPSAYVAPEQLRSLCASTEGVTESDGVQPASDLYSLGLIAIEALTGKPHSEFEYVQGSGLKWREAADVSLPLAEFVDRMVRQDWRDRFTNAKEALETFRWQRDRHNIANDSRMPTVVAAPGQRANGSLTLGSGAIRGTASTSIATLSVPHPYLHKLIIGSVAAVLALGVGVKAYQWGEYRVSKLPQTWQDWRTRGETYTPANPQSLVPLLSDGSILLQPAAVQAFWQMVSTAKEEGIALYPLSGHRASQPDAAADVGDYVTGYAVDIGGAEESSDRQAAFAQTSEFQWLKRNASTYGFELSTPKDRLLGGALEEPWHWRYVGDESSRAAFGL